MLSQFGCEFFFGGVINPETGMLLQIVTFFFVCYVSASATYESTGNVEMVYVAVVVPIVAFCVMYLPIILVSKAADVGTNM